MTRPPLPGSFLILSRLQSGTEEVCRLDEALAYADTCVAAERITAAHWQSLAEANMKLAESAIKCEMRLRERLHMLLSEQSKAVAENAALRARVAELEKKP